MLTFGLIAVSPTAAHGQRPSEVACCVRDRNCRATFVVAHRARGFYGPEQSRQANRRAIKAGVPVVEVDLRRSQGGELFVLHNEKLDRTTCHKGRIAGVASTEVAAARIKNGEFLPRFADVYQLSHGVAMLDLHLKIDAAEQVAEWLDRHGSFDDVIFFTDSGPRWRQPLLGFQTLLATAVGFVLTDDPRPLVARARNRRALGSCAVPR